MDVTIAFSTNVPNDLVSQKAWLKLAKDSLSETF